MVSKFWNIGIGGQSNIGIGGQSNIGSWPNICKIFLKIDLLVSRKKRYFSSFLIPEFIPDTLPLYSMYNYSKSNLSDLELSNILSI